MTAPGFLNFSLILGVGVEAIGVSFSLDMKLVPAPLDPHSSRGSGPGGTSRDKMSG